MVLKIANNPDDLTQFNARESHLEHQLSIQSEKRPKIRVL